MSLESFNPHNPEYKEVKDLPQEEQKNFADADVVKGREQAKKWNPFL